ncbi:MAG: efflux RND transporter permease subunit [Xanthomonadales bacterium]|nr:efflux RND transporter permease subunit [Xanthomonadales bacterium]
MNQDPASDILATAAARRPRVTDIFVQRPVVSLVLCVALLLFGARAAVDLPVQQYPKIESASLEIVTPYVGASAEIVQGFITEPIERVASSMPGIDYIDSITTSGLSTVRVWLNMNEDSSSALAELTARLNQIAFELPAGAQDPAVTVVRADRPYAAIYLDVVIRPPFTRASITDYLTREINPQLSAIPGVQRIGLEGGRQPAMRVWLDPERLAQFDLSTLDVQQAMTRNNVISTLGRSESRDQRINLLSNTALKSEEDFRSMVVRDRDGVQVRLGQVARIERGEQEGTTVARVTESDTVFISVWPLPGANEIEIGDALYQVLDELEGRLPEGISIGMGYDGTLYMRDALREIFITLGETILLVGLVVVLFMGSPRTALVPLIAIPISLLGAMAAMSLFGFSLNLLTVLAIVLSVGLVVDDAIVVVENVARYMREGRPSRDAALASSRQLLTPIIGMTLTLAAVYAPIGFVSGLTGVLFREFAFALATAVLVSGVVAITLSPIMSASLVPPGGSEGTFTRRVNAAFQRLQDAYTRALDATLDARGPIIALAVFFTLLVIPFYLFSQKELAPTEDQSSIEVVIESAPEASLPYTLSYTRDAVKTLGELPGAEDMWHIMNPEGGFGGQILTDPGERDESVFDLLQTAFHRLSQITGIKPFPFLASALPTAGNFDVELVVRSPEEPADMLPVAQAMVDAAVASGRFLYAQTDLKIDLPEARLIFDRERISDLGLDLASVSDQLGLLMSGDYVNRFDDNGRAFQVVPMLELSDRAEPAAMLNLNIRTSAGDLVPVRSIAAIEDRVAPRALTRFEQSNSFRIYGAAMPGSTKEQALSALERAAADILPASFNVDYAGESRQLRKEGNTMFGVLVISLVTVFLVLALQFNSLRDPMVVLVGSVPLALSGAMVVCFLDLTTINIYAQVGLITLVGLVSKNAILVVEFAGQMREEGYSRLDAIRASAVTRLRPVLMTTGATVLGHFPLVLVTGAGAEARNSIGLILVIGMLIGTLFTLFVLPQVYLLLAAPDSARDDTPAARGTEALAPV